MLRTHDTAARHAVVRRTVRPTGRVLAWIVIVGIVAAGLMLAASSACSQRRAPASAAPEQAALAAELEAIFARSARDWNAGDLDGFVRSWLEANAKARS